jgi:cell division protein FtsB
MLARQVHEEQRDLQQLQTHNKQLTNLAEYYKQPEVIESEARQRLGYTRPGEHAVIFVSAHAQEQQKVQKNNAGAKQQGFWQEWWHTFFGQ